MRQHHVALLALAPLALACSNPKSNACASYIASHADASTFCATFTLSSVTAPTALPAWASACDSKPSHVSKECSCAYTAGSGASPTTTKAAATTTAQATTAKTTLATTAKTTLATSVKTTTAAASNGGSGATPTGLTTALPKSSGAVSTSKAIAVTASFDGGMKLYDRSPSVCKDQSETGEADAMFILEDGATLSNVIIGPNQAEGVHCKGKCTLNNVWWQDVCEDAATFKQTSGTSYINGGGAFKASDKILQFNGAGTVAVKNFFASDYGKVSRSCGNCKDNGAARHFTFDNVHALDGGVLCGINSNYGDSCTITNSCQDSGKSCDRYEGNNSGAEPTKLSSGNDGKYCVVSGFSSTC